MPDPIVDVQELRKTYRSFSLKGRNYIQAVRGVSLQAYPGEVFGLLGPNGAGKTTLIKMLLGVVQPTSGTASLFGQRIGSVAARTRVGYLPESLRVDRHHTARSALRFYGRMSRMTATKINQRSDELLKLVGLAGRDRESVRRFSKGMYQRLGLAQALMHDPDLLVLDEPTDGLDPVGRNEVRKVIDRLRDAGKTIFLNSHILQEVELVCSRVAILSHGTIQAMGAIDELSQSDDQRLVVEVQASDESSAASQESANQDHGESVYWTGQLQWQSNLDSQADSVLQATRVRDVHRLMIPIQSQTQINEVVDRLRAAGHSISRLHVQKDSLEETFMRLVGNAEGSGTDMPETVGGAS